MTIGSKCGTGGNSAARSRERMFRLGVEPRPRNGADLMKPADLNELLAIKARSSVSDLDLALPPCRSSFAMAGMDTGNCRLSTRELIPTTMNALLPARQLSTAAALSQQCISHPRSSGWSSNGYRNKYFNNDHDSKNNFNNDLD